MGYGHTGGAERGRAGTGLCGICAVGEDLHHVGRVGRQEVIGDGLGVDHGAVDQRVASVELHRVVVHIGGVHDIHRGTGLRDVCHADRLCFLAREDRIGVRRVHHVVDGGEVVVGTCRGADSQPCATQCSAAVGNAVVVAVEARRCQGQAGIGVIVLYPIQKTRRAKIRRTKA